MWQYYNKFQAEGLAVWNYFPHFTQQNASQTGPGSPKPALQGAQRNRLHRRRFQKIELFDINARDASHHRWEDRQHHLYGYGYYRLEIRRDCLAGNASLLEARIREIETMQVQLREQAIRDALTG